MRQFKKMLRENNCEPGILYKGKYISRLKVKMFLDQQNKTTINNNSNKIRNNVMN